MLRKRVRFSTAAGIVFLVAVSAFAITNQVAEIKTKKPDVVYTEYKCVRCHVNDKTILRMQDKAGECEPMVFIPHRCRQNCQIRVSCKHIEGFRYS